MKLLLVNIALCMGVAFSACDKKETLSEVVERGLNVSSQQTMFLAEELENQKMYLQPIVTQYLVCNKSEIWP